MPTAEFQYNNGDQASAERSPFFLNYGYNPAWDFAGATESVVPAAEERVARLVEIL